MDCESCASADANPLSPLYAASCSECQARSLAHSPQRFDAIQAGVITPDYRSALQRTFGEAWKEGAAKVKAWAEKIDAAKREAETA